MSHVYDVAVIGMGSIGSSACYHLAKRGVDVLGIDQFDVPNALASHHGHSRMIRLCYYEHPDYVPLLRRAYELWREIEADCGQRLLHITGGLYLGEADDDFVAGSLASARQHGLPHAYLDRSQVRERFPQFDVPDHWQAIYEPEAGLLIPERVVEAFARITRNCGGTVMERHRVTQVIEEGQTLRIVTGRGDFRARHVVFTQGAWTRDVGVELTVTRQVLGWVEPARPDRFGADVFPSFAINNPDQSAHYGFPLIDDVPPQGLLKIAHHWHDRPTSPETINRDPEPGDVDDFLPTLRRFLPEADGPVRKQSICMYTNSPDSHFVIDRHPAYPAERATVACGFSGHGFKFASVMGEAIADLATSGRTDLPIGFLSRARFGAT